METHQMREACLCLSTRSHPQRLRVKSVLRTVTLGAREKQETVLLPPANSIKQRKPSLLLPPAARGPESAVTVLRGDTLVLECFAEGL